MKGKPAQREHFTADGFAERRAALKLLARIRSNSSVAVKTLGADKGWHSQDFVHELRERHIRPHIAVRKDRVSQGLDGRTTNSRGSGLSQHRRKLIEQPFGWLKG